MSKLGVNIDHVATLRNARGENHPNILKFANIAINSGADSITVHLREDRRHIKDKDVIDLKNKNYLPLNLEMAATQEMKDICLDVKPEACCIVPERREELTTEGGLNVMNQQDYLSKFIPEILSSNTKLSLFIDPELDQIKAAHELGVKVIEIHTGKFSRCFDKDNYLI